MEMVKTYPSYKNFLIENDVEEGSQEDPLKMLGDVLLKEGGNKKIDIICPFFSVVAKKNSEKSI